MKFIVSIFCCLLFPVTFAMAGHLDLVQSREQKHFDRDRDGLLNPYELGLYQTYLYKKYPLVKKRKQLPYDSNRDGMLEPFEEQRYKEDKEKGILGEVYKDFKRKQKRGQIIKIDGEEIQTTNRVIYSKDVQKEMRKLQKQRRKYLKTKLKEDN